MDTLTIYEVGKGTNIKRYVRVNKSVARKAYNKGLGVYMNACKLRPFSMWGTTSVSSLNAVKKITFDEYINNFEAYNCSYETGKYVSYYISISDYAKVTGRIV